MSRLMKLVLPAAMIGLLVAGLAFSAASAPEEPLDADKIAAASGAKTTVTPDGVVRIGWPRDDVKVQVDGVPLKPFAGLGSWAAFTAAPHGAMVMGDTVVFQDEVTPAMDAAFAHGLEVTGLHNHFFYDEPKVYFMHIGGQGEPEKLAAGVKAVWDADQEGPSRRTPSRPPRFEEIGPEADAIEPQADRGDPRPQGPEPGRGGQGHDRPRGDDARGQGRRLDGPDDLGRVHAAATRMPSSTATSS